MPPAIKYGHHKFGNISLSSIVRYKCFLPYTLSGDSSTMCQSNGMWEAAPSCGEFLTPNVCIYFFLYHLAVVTRSSENEVYVL